MAEALEREATKKAPGEPDAIGTPLQKEASQNKPLILDMGEGSRLQGFKLNGSR